MNIQDIQIRNTTVTGIEIPLPNAPLIIISAPKGYLMCGYLDLGTAEKMGDCAAIIRGIHSIDEMLKGKIVAVTAAAAESGITLGMSGRDALEKLL